MKKAIISFTAFLFSAILFANPILISDFKIVKKEGGITLYERWITGSKHEPVRELKAEFMVKSKMENVVTLLKNQNLGTKWNQNAQSYKIVESANSGEWINYIRYDMPVFFDDQDCCLHYKAPDASTVNKQIIVIPFQSIRSNLFPDEEGVKRINGVKGEWKIEQQNDGLKIIYIISSDRSKSVPRFISDPIVHQNLFKSMTSFKSLLEKNHE
jgi:hypothetical protein